YYFFFSSRRRHTRSLRDWSSDVCSSDLALQEENLSGAGLDLAGLGVRIALHADGLALALAGAGVGLGALAAHGQAATVADGAIAVDAREALHVRIQLTAKVAFDDDALRADDAADLRELLIGELTRAGVRVDVGLS